MIGGAERYAYELALTGSALHVGIISFSDHAYEELSLTEVQRIEEIPALRAQGSTAYGDAFRLLRIVLERDVEELLSQGRRVARPVVFFITDGSPVDDGRWQIELQRIKSDSNRYRPRLIAFGLADLDPSILSEISDGQAFRAIGGAGPEILFDQVARSIASSLTSSAQTINSSTDDALVLPAVPGMEAIYTAP